MKRHVVLAVLLLVLAAVAGCAAERGGLGDWDREAVLQQAFFDRLAGSPMKLALDARDGASGLVRWAWEDTDGIPKLVSVEIYAPPADAAGLYERAAMCDVSESLAISGADASSYDGRAAHVLAGACYARIAVLGFADDDAVLRQVAARLVPWLKTIE